MVNKLRYVTDEQGKQVAVLLDLDEYRRLVQHSPADPDLLFDLSQAELEALAGSKLAPVAQARLDELLARNEGQQLSRDEIAELDGLLAHVDQLTILKTRARYTLQQQEQAAATAR